MRIAGALSRADRTSHCRKRRLMHELTAILVSMVLSATPLLLAASGELVTEKSGVLNLGVEGMMVVGAVVGFGVAFGTDSAIAGFAVAAIAGALMAALFAVLTLIFLANQVATGLALTIFGLGLSALMGKAYIGKTLPPVPHLHIPGISDIPLVGPLIFGENAMVYVSVAFVIAIAWYLSRTVPGWCCARSAKTTTPRTRSAIRCVASGSSPCCSAARCRASAAPISPSSIRRSGPRA